MIPYSWYIQNYTPTSFDESGHGIYQPMSEDEWSRLPQNYQQQEISDNPQGGNGFYDQGLAQRFEAAVGPRPDGYERGMSAVRRSTINHGFSDPSRVWTDPDSGIEFTWDENYTPEAQNRDTGYFGERPWLTGIGTVLGAGMAYNAFGAGMAGAEGLGADAIQAGENVGSVLGNGGGLPESYWSAVADSGGFASDALPEGVDIFSSPEYWTGDPSGSTFMNGPAVNASSYANTPFGNLQLGAHNAINGNWSLPSLSDVGSSIASNPLRAYQAASALATMFSGAGNDDEGGEGDGGPTELGSMGWKPPESKPYQPSEAWKEQYRRSRMSIGELRRMYGNG